jgi:hypothetical protein
MDRDLSESAYAVADRYRSGGFPELEGKPWGDVWAALVRELRNMHPARSEAECSEALNAGFTASR